MNREIKFRAWDDGKMVYEKDISHLSLEDNDIYRLAKFFCNVRNDSKIMQFTGFIDKNSNEIYEGDIIDLSGTYKYKVVYEAAKFVCYHVIERYGRWGDLKRLFDADFSEYYFQVVGNIFENPELLEKTKEITK